MTCTRPCYHLFVEFRKRITLLSSSMPRGEGSHLSICQSFPKKVHFYTQKGNEGTLGYRTLSLHTFSRKKGNISAAGKCKGWWVFHHLISFAYFEHTLLFVQFYSSRTVRARIITTF